MGLSFEIGFSNEGLRDLKRVDKKDRQKILKKILQLKDFRDNNNIKKLRGELGEYYRLRVGKIRVGFQIDQGKRRILIEFVGYRGGVYK